MKEWTFFFFFLSFFKKKNLPGANRKLVNYTNWADKSPPAERLNIYVTLCITRHWSSNWKIHALNTEAHSEWNLLELPCAQCSYITFLECLFIFFSQHLFYMSTFQPSQLKKKNCSLWMNPENHSMLMLNTVEQQMFQEGEDREMRK